ncbi:bifunctional 3-(3-hydroxy-phenyl)propionate/3-hydroxycinnamic acid hydroxylase [Streptomyces sp. NPDC048282]|uniref:bifunctional 3-(3-hydroxy-phenyl)propionate/3-hydroxycinnamic acid hydroxylase n=1 Tax=unclassified Streptomyces TaxID=2593676 RepID=UPI003716D797
MTRYDVAIVGCGPVGLTLSHLLGKQGLKVVCLEREPEAAHLPRAGHVDAEALRVWQAAGVEKPALTALSESVGFDMRDEAGEILVEYKVPPGIGPYGWPHDFSLKQPTLEHALRGCLPDTVDLRVGVEVTAIDQDADGVTVTYAGGSLTAGYVVGCDGGSSFTRKSMGSAFEVLGPDDPYLVIDAELTDSSLRLEPGGHLYATPARPHYLRVSGTTLRWEFKVLPGDDTAELTRPETVHRMLEPWVGPDQIVLERAVVYVFHSLLADQWRRGRVLLAGDAAHLQPPFHGQGLCSGIRDVANLSWKLAQVVRGEATDALLDTYQSERAPHAREWIVEATALGALVQTTDPVVARERDAKLRAGDRGALRPIRPVLGPGVRQNPGSAHDGTLSIQPWLAGGALLDDVVGFRYAVAATEDTLRGVDTGDAVIIDEPGTLLDHYGTHAVVIRPDRYVLGTAEDPAGLQALLDEADRFSHR